MALPQLAHYHRQLQARTSDQSLIAVLRVLVNPVPLLYSKSDVSRGLHILAVVRVTCEVEETRGL